MKSVVQLATLMPPGLLLIGSGQGRAAASLADSVDLPTVMVRAVGHISRRRYAAQSREVFLACLAPYMAASDALTSASAVLPSAG